MSIFKTEGVVERLNAACGKSAKAPDLATAHRILEDAIAKEVAIIEKIKDMPGFAQWIGGHQIDLGKARARK